MAEEVDGGAIVYQMTEGQPQYLLLKSSTSDFWGFPKGHVEQDDKDSDISTLVQTARRETKEETNLDIDVDTGFDDKIDYDMSNGNHKTVTFYVSEVDPSVIVTKQDKEISNYGWFDYNQARNQLTYDNLRQLLDRANKYITNK